MRPNVLHLEDRHNSPRNHQKPVWHLELCATCTTMLNLSDTLLCPLLSCGRHRMGLSSGLSAEREPKPSVLQELLQQRVFVDETDRPPETAS